MCKVEAIECHFGAPSSFPSAVSAGTFLHANPSAHACVYAAAAAARGRAECGLDAFPVKRTKSATKRTSNPVEMCDARSRALYSL